MLLAKDFAFSVSRTFPTNVDRDSLQIIDNTRLTAVNTCPRWGAIRYGHNKTLSTGEGRALALEAGAACHQGFAAVRLLHLYAQGNHEQAIYHTARLFPKTIEGCDKPTHEYMRPWLESKEDFTIRAQEMALLGLAHSQYYDDPNDKKRTYTNLEESLVKYARRYNPKADKIWVRDHQNPTSDVGIEIPFDLCFTATRIGDRGIVNTLQHNGFACRFVGRIDGIHEDDTRRLIVKEEKTTSLISSTWVSGWAMAHQITGYIVAASTYTGKQVNHGCVNGLAIPQPKSSPYDGFVSVPFVRDQDAVVQWLQWFLNSYTELQQYVANPLDAPTYTHSCTRYFRECPQLPLCTATREEQEHIFNNEMVVKVWNPLEEELAE